MLGSSLIKKRFKIDAKTHAHRRACTGDMIEHGGNFFIDVHKGVVVGAIENEGRYSRIQMTRGLMDWHSHPSKCKNENSCALGIPSPDDIENIVMGAIYKNKGHLVYAKEGTYFIQLTPQRIQLLSCDYARLETYLDDLRRLSDKLHRSFMRKKFAYKQYTRVWCDLMRKCGLTIQFFKGNTLPRFDLYINKSDSNDAKLYEAIQVPIDVQRDTQRLANCPAGHN
jgi:hypothetical protein